MEVSFTAARKTVIHIMIIWSQRIINKKNQESGQGGTRWEEAFEEAGGGELWGGLGNSRVGQRRQQASQPCPSLSEA